MDKRKSLISQVVPDAKRRLRLSLNSRYDKMMETMRLARIYPRNKDSKYKKPSGRSAAIKPGYASDERFTRSSGCTEEDFNCSTDDDLRSTLQAEDHPCEEDMAISYSPTGKDPLPGWLAHTFATLPQGHPLRISLSSVLDSPSDTRLSSDLTAIETPSMVSESEYPISFINMENGSRSPTLVINDSQRISDCSSSSLVESASYSAHHLPKVSEGIKPFSTPGPASTIFRVLTPPLVTFDNVDLQSLQPPFECTESSDRGAMEGPYEAGLEDWQHLSPDRDIVISPFATPVHINGSQDVYSSPDPARAAFSTGKAASFEPEDHLKSSLPPPSEITDLDFRWTAFDRKGTFQGAGPYNLGPDKSRIELHLNHFTSGEEHTLSDRSPSPDELFFQTVLNAELKS